MFCIRVRAGRSWVVGGVGVPVVSGSGFLDEVSGGDGRVGEGGERVDHAGVGFGADLEFLERVSVSGVGVFHDPAGVGLWGCALLADHSCAAEGVQQVVGFVGVVVGVQVRGDLFGQVEPEPVQLV